MKSCFHAQKNPQDGAQTWKRSGIAWKHAVIAKEMYNLWSRPTSNSLKMKVSWAFIAISSILKRKDRTKDAIPEMTWRLMKTNWGCTHRPGGDAYIEGTRDFCRKASSSVRIYDLRCEELKTDGWREPPFFRKRGSSEIRSEMHWEVQIWSSRSMRNGSLRHNIYAWWVWSGQILIVIADVIIRSWNGTQNAVSKHNWNTQAALLLCVRDCMDLSLVLNHRTIYSLYC
jgi:hypothetical protein